MATLKELQKKKSELESSIGVLLMSAQGDNSVLPTIQNLEDELAEVEKELGRVT